MSLEDISAKSRISVRMLEAIESEQFDLLPGGVFNVSFIRQYAHHVGLDEDKIAEQFKRLAQPTELKLTESAKVSPEIDAAQEVRAALAENVTEYTRRHQVAFPAILVVLAILAIVAVLFSGWDQTEDDVADRPQVEAPSGMERDDGPGEAEVIAPASSQAPAEPQPRESAPQPATEPSKPVIVKLDFTDTVWIQALADGERVLSDTFRAGDSKSIEADGSVHLVVGNAAAVTIALNGERMPPIGPQGAVRRVRLTPKGMEFVQPPLSPADSDTSPANSVQTDAANQAGQDGRDGPVVARIGSSGLR